MEKDGNPENVRDFIPEKTYEILKKNFGSENKENEELK